METNGRQSEFTQKDDEIQKNKSLIQDKKANNISNDNCHAYRVHPQKPQYSRLV